MDDKTLIWLGTIFSGALALVKLVGPYLHFRLGVPGKEDPKVADKIAALSRKVDKLIEILSERKVQRAVEGEQQRQHIKVTEAVYDDLQALLRRNQ